MGVEDTDCIFAEWLEPPKERLVYDTKQSAGEAPVSGGLGNMDYLFIDIVPKSTRILTDCAW